MLRFIVSIAIVLLQGCVFVDKPLIEKDKSWVDENILGIWMAADSHQVFHIGMLIDNSGNKLIEIISIEHKKDGTLDQEKFQAWPVKIGDNTFLNIQIKSVIEDLDFNYVYIPYKFIDASNIEVCLLNFEQFIKEVDNQKIQGKTLFNKTGEYLILKKQDKVFFEYFNNKKIGEYSSQCEIYKKGG